MDPQKTPAPQPTPQDGAAASTDVPPSFDNPNDLLASLKQEADKLAQPEAASAVPATPPAMNEPAAPAAASDASPMAPPAIDVGVASLTAAPAAATPSEPPKQDATASVWSGTPGEGLSAATQTSPEPAESPATPVIAAPLPDMPHPATAAPAVPAEPSIPVVGSEAVGSSATPKAGKKKWFMGLFALAAVLVLGGGSAAAYFGYYVPRQPNNVLAAALSNLFVDNDIKSGYFEGKAKFTSTAEKLTLTSNFSGKANDQGAVQINADVDALVTKITFEARSVNGTSYYVKVGGLDGYQQLLGGINDADVQALAPFITALNGHWIEINQSLLTSMNVTNPLPSVAQPNTADKKKLGDIYKKHRFLMVTQTLPDQVIKGASSYHYKVVADKAELKAAYLDLKDANIKDLKITQDQVTGFNKSVDGVDFTKYPVDIWIAKDTKLPNQLAFTVKNSDTTVDLQVTLFDLNKPVSVEKPADAQSLLQVLGQVFGSKTPVGSAGGSANTQFLQDLQGSGISL